MEYKTFAATIQKCGPQFYFHKCGTFLFVGSAQSPNFLKKKKKQEMLTLYFLVVGEGRLFPVKIDDEGKTVGVLKEEISNFMRFV
jgi:hypothetical protein